MFKKLQNKLQQIKQKVNNINELYADYFLCNAFLSLIIFKINKIFFQISWIYLYPSIILFSIIFLNQWLFIVNYIKNTYLFNWFLYYFLIFKNHLYGLIFEYFDYIEHEKYQKLLVFLTGFILSSWGLNLFFFFLNNFYNLFILMFFFFLILNVFNLIEKKLLFNEKNLKNKDQELNYNQIQSILNINTQKFKKNHSLFYIQKRYIHFNEFKNFIKKHGITIFSSTAAGTLLSIGVQIKNVNVQQEQVNVQREQVNVQREQLNFLKIEHQDNIKLEYKKINSKKKKNIEDYILNYDERIKEINNKEYQIGIEMNSCNFWNKLDMTDLLNELREEKNYLKKKRDEAEKEMKINIDNEDLISNKKQKLDKNFLDDE